MIEGFGEVTFGIHICRGNPRIVDPATGKVMPQWHREGHYDAIAEQLFSELRHDRLLLEYDSERAGSFAPLRFVPKNKVAVLGLVTTKIADVEPLDALRRRITRPRAICRSTSSRSARNADSAKAPRCHRMLNGESWSVSWKLHAWSGAARSPANRCEVRKVSQ